MSDDDEPQVVKKKKKPDTEPIDYSLLVEGSAFKIGEAAYDDRMRLAHVPKEYWDIKFNDVAFLAFKQRPYMMDKAGQHHYAGTEQRMIFEHLLGTIMGRTKNALSDYDSYVFSIASNPTDHMACCVVAVIIKTFMRYFDAPRIQWVDANKRSKGGYSFVPDADYKPHMTIVTGLHPNPTGELVESVKRWTSWTKEAAGITFLIGCGLDPVEIAEDRFRVKADRYLHGFGASKRVRTAG